MCVDDEENREMEVRGCKREEESLKSVVKAVFGMSHPCTQDADILGSSAHLPSTERNKLELIQRAWADP